MMPTKSLLNFGVLVILVIRPRVHAVTLKYEEPFPPRLPVQVKSQVAFTQYGNVPMLSLDEIKNGFPWLKMSAESVADHEQSETGPRYMFYYLPTDVALQPSNAAALYNGHESPQSDVGVKPVVLKGKKLRYRGRSKARLSRLTLPKNHKFTDQDLPVGAQYLNVADTRSVPSYSYPKVPSPYMQPPRLKFEEKEFWVKNKRKSKRPVKDTDFGNEARLKNHRNVKQNKSKRVNLENEQRLKNHKPTYDREHDPEEGAESSDVKVEKQPRRPKEKTTQNPLLLSQDGERVQFQIHGHEGPQTYIFGFDTGNGKNRHFRLEERLRDGSVKGHYGYYDAYGKLKMVEYKTRPMEGYEEQHHVSGAHTTTDKEDSDDKAKS